MTGLNDIMVDIRTKLKDFEGTPEERQKFLDESVIYTYQVTEKLMAPALAQSPYEGLNFIKNVKNSLGAVNEVAVKEFDLNPIQIQDLKLVTVETMVAITGRDIDSIVEMLGEN